MSVSLLAAAAVAASVFLAARQRQERTSIGVAVPAGETMPGEPSLEAIRAAGF